MIAEPIDITVGAFKAKASLNKLLFLLCGHPPEQEAIHTHNRKWVEEAEAVEKTFLLSRLTPPKIGSFWEGQGGLYAGVMGNPNGPDYYLIAAEEQFVLRDIQWSISSSKDSDAASNWEGWTNTHAINDAEHPAANQISKLTIGGHTDWYLPAIRELTLVLTNLSAFAGYRYWSSTRCLKTQALARDLFITEQKLKIDFCSAIPVRRVGMGETT